MRPIVYIETTIPSYYYDERPSLLLAIERTREWWDSERFEYELITSEPVLDELDDPDNPNRERCLDLMREIPVVDVSVNIEKTAEVYVRRQVMPEAKGADALHLAIASHYRADFLLTWNCRHLANANKFRTIYHLNSEMGLFVPVLTTPFDLRTLPKEGVSYEEP